MLAILQPERIEEADAIFLYREGAELTKLLLAYQWVQLSLGSLATLLSR
jgi:hypothetical protein